MVKEAYFLPRLAALTLLAQFLGNGISFSENCEPMVFSGHVSKTSHPKDNITSLKGNTWGAQSPAAIRVFNRETSAKGVDVPRSSPPVQRGAGGDSRCPRLMLPFPPFSKGGRRKGGFPQVRIQCRAEKRLAKTRTRLERPKAWVAGEARVSGFTL